MRHTIYDVTVDELEWLVKFEMTEPVSTRRVRRLFNNFISKMLIYEKEHGGELSVLYQEDYRDILTQIGIKQDPAELIKMISTYDWSKKTFVMVMGNQLVEVWKDTLCPMNHDYMRSSFQAVLTYVSMGIQQELLRGLPPKGYGMNVGQSLAWSNTMAILNRALDIAVIKKQDGSL